MNRTIIKCCSWYWKTALEIHEVIRECSYRENCPHEYGKASKKDGMTIDIICGLGYNSSKETSTMKISIPKELLDMEDVET